MTTGRINQVANPCVRQSPHATPRPGHTHTDLSVDGEAMRCAAGVRTRRQSYIPFFWFVLFLLWPEKRRTREHVRTQFLPSARHPFPSLATRSNEPHPKAHGSPDGRAACTRQPRMRGTPHVAAALPPEPEPERSKPNPGRERRGEIRCKGPQRSRVLAMPYSPPNRRLLSNPRRALRSARLGWRDQLKSDHRTDGRLHQSREPASTHGYVTTHAPSRSQPPPDTRARTPSQAARPRRAQAND